MTNKDTGGPAFPSLYTDGPDVKFSGMSMRDWFATHAPQPLEADIIRMMGRDRQANPHNDYEKPPIRDRVQIICDLNYEYADAMIEARKK